MSLTGCCGRWPRPPSITAVPSSPTWPATCSPGVARLCGTARPVALYPSSGTGAWEAALVNTLSPGDRVLAFDTGHFATLWAQMARKLGLDVDARAR